MKNKVGRNQSQKRGVTINDDSSEGHDISDYSSDVLNDSLEAKSKRSSYQALSGDEDIDTLYQKALAGGKLGSSKQNTRKSNKYESVNKRGGGSRNNNGTRAHTLKSNERNEYMGSISDS